MTDIARCFISTTTRHECHSCVGKIEDYRFIKILLVFLIIFGITDDISYADSTPHKSRILLISSYHPGFPTFFEQIDGIKSVLSKSSVILDVEFMDAKRFSDAESKTLFYKMLSHKLAKLPPYDLFLVSDDNALSFVLEHQNDLFGQRPMVFLGINNTTLAMQLNDNPYITGIVEAVSMQDTLLLMKKLQPGIKKIVALVDSTSSGQADLQTFHKTGQNTNELKEIELSEISLAKLSYDQFGEKLRTLQNDTGVLLLSAYQDVDGKGMLFDESLRFIKANLHQPLFHLWYHGMGDGILGGKLISHFKQGEAAAQIALDVLNGKEIKNIPVNMDSPNRYMFDYQQLQQFGINEAELPGDAVIINQPHSFYKTHKVIVWISAFAFLTLISFIVTLALNIQRRKLVERELMLERSLLEERVKERTTQLLDANKTLTESEARYLCLANAAFEGILISENGVILEANTAIANMYGYSVNELIGIQVADMIVPNGDGSSLINFVENFGETLECIGLSKNKARFPIEVRVKAFAYRGSDVMVTAVRDITQRKKAEAEITILQKILPICSYCKKIRNDTGYWSQVESYISEHSDTQFSHSICEECFAIHFPQFAEKLNNTDIPKQSQSEG